MNADKFKFYINPKTDQIIDKKTLLKLSDYDFNQFIKTDYKQLLDIYKRGLINFYGFSIQDDIKNKLIEKLQQLNDDKKIDQTFGLDIFVVDCECEKFNLAEAFKWFCDVGYYNWFQDRSRDSHAPDYDPDKKRNCFFSSVLRPNRTCEARHFELVDSFDYKEIDRIKYEFIKIDYHLLF